MATPLSSKQLDALGAGLRALAGNLWWSWNPPAQEIFEELSPYLWERSNHNPVEVLHGIGPEEIRLRLRTPEFRAKVQAAWAAFDRYCRSRETWCDRHAPE